LGTCCCDPDLGSLPFPSSASRQPPKYQ
jgi:hypothetical protein